MKNSIFLLCILCFMCTACGTDDMEPEAMTKKDMKDDTISGEVAYLGDFMNDAHPTSGIASIGKSETSLNFTDFKTDNGPLLEVYLATDKEASDYITLGELKGIEGDFSYSIPKNVNLDKHKYVLIWCVDFSVNFGYAVLEMP
ncbi:DM13 domain-containing protein [Echinicola soli]|uniref:DM13 domain-containing protein n=1 Tax=Echinicola soli TaxID=2591634 RepID=A0A514CKN5_9BACT|nr:DM13 domain-containing protein [Echinicola soli]QDH80405.1 DM13 domain-containing protein [Echinicola soli]